MSAWTATAAAFVVILTGLVLFRGEVVKLEHTHGGKDEDRKFTALHLTYPQPNGTEREVTQVVPGHVEGYAPGDALHVLVDPRDPDAFVLPNILSVFCFSLCCCWLCFTSC